ncbi:hypothetical protein AAGF08_04210 [Algoriphagus sp. SE2]|uniref:M61 family metallopeptidase n=1 Tax=Algoriphagus sp. SE2 TaxID=3141536 RepID=UPI0031CD3E97
MKKLTLQFLLILFAGFSYAQSEVAYLLNHTPNSDKIEVVLEFETLPSSSIKLVIPRSAPGTYELTNYFAFVDQVKGYTVSGKTLNGIMGDGSYFLFEESDESVKKISYEVDVRKMELDLLGSYASSKMRDNYLGILGYSVFGFVEGLESKPIELTINTNKDWPIFSTLRPSIEQKKGTDFYEVDNFSLLVDAQFLLGKAVQIFQVKDAEIPLFVAAYSETPINMEEIGRRGLLSLNGLANYFGYIPMPHYTMCYEFLKPISRLHDYGFSMEHLNSMTASMDTSKAILAYQENANIGTIVHHIGHSWLPLRSYGTGYRPFEWQTAPIIETIWMNEGFMWYISFYNVLNDKTIPFYFFNKNMDEAPDYIQEKSLKDLSILGSTQYGLDFRIGKNLFSRGALLAHDLDVVIQEKTSGEKSFKDAILGLLNWTKENGRAFEYDQIESIMSEATGVDLKDVWDEWQKPRKK